MINLLPYVVLIFYGVKRFFVANHLMCAILFLEDCLHSELFFQFWLFVLDDLAMLFIMHAGHRLAECSLETARAVCNQSTDQQDDSREDQHEVDLARSRFLLRHIPDGFKPVNFVLNRPQLIRELLSAFIVSSSAGTRCGSRRVSFLLKHLLLARISQ